VHADARILTHVALLFSYHMAFHIMDTKMLFGRQSDNIAMSMN